MERIGFVACVKGKRDTPAPAGDLYTSDLFRKASGYARASYDRWFILSAKHGLLAPDRVIEPYDETLVGARASVKRGWAWFVAGQLAAEGLLDDELYIHAGEDYAGELLPLLAGTRVERPLRGLAIGQQKRWYKERGF